MNNKNEDLQVFKFRNKKAFDKEIIKSLISRETDTFYNLLKSNDTTIKDLNYI